MSNYEIISLKQEIATVLSKSAVAESVIAMILREASDEYEKIAIQKYNQEAFKKAMEDKNGNRDENDNP